MQSDDGGVFYFIIVLQIMGQTVTTDITTLQFKADSKTFTPGEPVQLSVSQLPTGGFFAVRASGQV